MAKPTRIEHFHTSRGPKREAAILVIGVAAGALVLPSLIYLCGIAFLGRFDGSGLGRTYATVLFGLAQGSLASWCVVLGPYVLFQFFRGVYAWWCMRAA